VREKKECVRERESDKVSVLTYFWVHVIHLLIDLSVGEVRLVIKFMVKFVFEFVVNFVIHFGVIFVLI
jgi:hypothetical protein